MEGTEGAEATGDGSKRRRLKGKSEAVPSEVERSLRLEVDAVNEEISEMAETRQQQRVGLRRMLDCYTQRARFIELLDSSETRLRQLLTSRTPSDVIEAISVVVELRVRDLPAAAGAFDQVLSLVWSRHPPVKDAAVEAFHRMSLQGRDAAGAVGALLDMYHQGCSSTWTYTHLASVQELIQQAAEQGIVQASLAIPELVSRLQSPACAVALRALTAFAGADWKALASELPRISSVLRLDGAVRTGAGDRLERTRLTCLMLQRLLACAKSLTGEAWNSLWSLSQQAVCVLVEHFVSDTVPAQWFGAAQATIDLSFDLMGSVTKENDTAQKCPDKLWEQILERMFRHVLSGSAPSSAQSFPDDRESSELATAGAIVPADGETPMHSHIRSLDVSAPRLACVTFLAGHLGLRMVVFLESLQAAIKKRRMSEEDSRMSAQREKRGKQKKGKGKGAAEDEAGEASSMGMAGVEEREADAFAEMAETALLYGPRGILSRVRPMILVGLVNPSHSHDPILRRVAAISLCKYMTVSKRFCEDHLQLLFSVLFPKAKDGEASAPAVSTEDVEVTDVSSLGAGPTDDLTLRQSLLVAVGDLLFRHPNVVEPWTDRLYAALGGVSCDASDAVAAAELRLSALLVLTHLVLNDMMKARPDLLIRALWLTACPHERTSRVARLLFAELGKKTTNVVYNLLPEIVARMPELRMSAGCGAAEDRVRWIMQFVDKERHVEGLIEKFSLRLAQSADRSGKADGSSEVHGTPVDAVDHSLATVSCLSHAVGSMNYTDRCIMRLHDVVVVRKVLNVAISYHGVVRDCLLGVLERARRKPGRTAAAETQEETPSDTGVAQKGGPSPAAVAAMDAIEKVVTGLTQGEAAAMPDPTEDGSVDAVPLMDIEPVAKAEGKRKLKPESSADVEPGFEEEAGKSTGRGRGRGRGVAQAGHVRSRGKRQKQNDRE